MEYVVTRILDRDITLTSRTSIYTEVLTIMKSHWLIGFGYGSMVLWNKGIADAQNGILEWLEYVGVVGTILLLIWTGIAMKKLKSNSLKTKQVPFASLVALVYVFVLLATVENTFSIRMLCLILVIYGVKVSYEKKIYS